MRACYLHPHTTAVAYCTDCGQPVCGVCLVRVNNKPYCEHCAVNRHQQSPFWAGVFSAFVPGLGQFYNGEHGKGIAILLTGWLILPWLYGVIDAVLTAQAIALGEREACTLPPGYVILGLKIGLLGLSCAYLSLAWALVGMAATAIGWSLTKP
ncbi:MAG: B-box zinc finger protein [Fimbriimonadales bacterium]